MFLIFMILFSLTIDIDILILLILVTDAPSHVSTIDDDAFIELPTKLMSEIPLALKRKENPLCYVRHLSSSGLYESLERSTSQDTK